MGGFVFECRYFVKKLIFEVRLERCVQRRRVSHGQGTERTKAGCWKKPGVVRERDLLDQGRYTHCLNTLTITESTVFLR